MLEWKRLLPPLSHAHIEEWERTHGISLPPRYRIFLLSTNGGQPSSDVGFDILDGKHKVMLGALYGISAQESSLSLQSAYEDLKDELPKGFLPIGEDPGGNQLLLATEGHEKDAIYFLDRVGILAKQEGNGLFRIADDISRFVESLHTMG